MIYKVEKFSELSTLVTQAIQNTKFSNNELHALISASENISISIPYFSMLKDGITLSSIQKHNDVSLTIDNFKKYFEIYGNSFSLIAKTINTKIKR